MAITAIVGRPGHGKSYSAMEIAIIPALEEGRAIYTNIPLRDEAIYADYPGARINYVQLTALEINDPEFWLFEPGCLVIFDELWRVWPSGLKANKVPVHQLAFIKEHRHRTDDEGRWQDIVLVTQNLSDIACSIREMVETTIICMQLQDVGATGWFVREYYTGAIKGCESGPKEKLVNNERIKYQDFVYRYYVSNTQGTNKNVGPQGRKVVQQTVFSGWKFKAFVVSLVLVIVALIFSIRSTTTGMEDIKIKANAANSIQPAVLPVAPTTPPSPAPVQVVAPSSLPPPPELQPSKTWRVSGSVQVPGKPRLILITDGKATRRLLVGKQCTVDDGEILCTLGPEVIATWTGEHSRPFTMSPLATLAPNLSHSPW